MGLAVVVPTRARPVRLRWLLLALAEQDSRDFEVVVAHNPDDHASAAVLRDFPAVHAIVADGGPAALRNAAWRAVDADLLLFTDDDCRPPAGWITSALDAAAAHPGAIVQGATRPDPDEIEVFRRAPHARSQEISPPHPMAQTCNILYPRAVLESVGGFDEDFPQAVGEDTDLALRARAAGTRYVAAPAMLTFHAVETGLLRRLRGSWRWQHMALLVRRHPELRDDLPLGGLAWKSRHVWLAIGLAGLAAGRPVALAPYLATTPRRYGDSPRALARSALEIPGRAVVDAFELAAMVRGSVRYRTPLL